ncbi:MAG: hypothetical protein ABII19_01790 [Patescibacteria group bacterium]
MDQETKQEFETLAKIIKEGFDQTATKEELEQMATKEGLEQVKSDLEHVENQMVTKDYLDTKLVEHYGNIVVLMRKGDGKLLRLVELLKEKNVLSDEEVKSLLVMEPFPKLV